jgi:hypothetical protein
MKVSGIWVHSHATREISKGDIMGGAKVAPDGTRQAPTRHVAFECHPYLGGTLVHAPGGASATRSWRVCHIP